METSDFSHHISRQFDEELSDLRASVLAMGGLVEEQVRHAMQALIDNNGELGSQVAANDDKVNNAEVSIDEECSRILALRQPAASDLRLVVAIIKTISDLERVGDEAQKIGYLAARLAEQQTHSSTHKRIKHLGRQIIQMVSGMLDAFARLDADSALEILASDDNVDEEYEAIMRQSITVMMEDPRSIRQVLDTMWAARSLERIGDHACNVCEYVIYMVHGQSVRHGTVEEITRQIEKLTATT